MHRISERQIAISNQVSKTKQNHKKRVIDQPNLNGLAVTHRFHHFDACLLNGSAADFHRACLSL
jgi:hypothetical protein